MAQLNWDAFLKNRTYNYVTRTPEQFDAGRHIGEEPRGLLGSAWDNLWGGMESMVGGAMDTAGTMLKAQYAEGRASHPAGVFGKFLVDRAIDLNQSAAENARRSGVRNEYSDMGIFDRLTSPSYLLDPRGFTAEVSNMTGSMIPFMLMSAVMPEVGAGTAAGLIGGGLSRFGVKKAAELFKPGGAGAEFLRDFSRWAPTGVVDAAANAGEVAEEMRRQGYTDSQISNHIGSAMSYELPYDVVSQGLFGGFLGGKGVRKLAEGGSVRRNIAANAALGGLEALNEAGQEFVQTQAVEQALGKPVGTFMNPTDEERKAFDAAFIGTLPMVAAGGARNVTKNWLRGKVESGQSELQSSAPVKTSGDENTDALIAQAAEKYGVPVNLLHSVAQTESGYNQGAKSEAGAIGMMQLMPDTAAGLGVDPNDLAGNIEGGAKYLREMLDTFDGNVEKAVAAYNAGPNAVKQHGGIPPFEETQDYVRKVLGGLDGYDVDIPQRIRSLAEDAAPFLGVTMNNGENGCVEAVTKIGAKSCPFLAQELSSGVVNVDRLVEDAGNNVIPFDPNQLEEGDVIVYGDASDPQRHVVLYDGKGGYIGNSTEQNKVVQGSDYNAMGNWTPTKIIKTGAQFGGAHSAAPVMPDFTGLIADEKNIQATQEAIQKLIDTDSLTPEQHMAIIQAAEMARDTPVGNGVDGALEAETVNEWQRLIDRKDAKGIFEKDPKRIVQHLQRLEKTQKMQRTQAAIENQQQIEATKQALQAVQQAQNAQAVPTQGDASVQQIVPEQIAQPMMDGQVSPTIQQAGDMQGANAAQMSAPIQPENVMQNPQMVQGTDGQIAPQNIPVQNMFDAPVPQNAVNSAVPTPSEALATGVEQAAADAQPMPQPMETQANIDDVQQAIQQREVPLLSIPAYVQARQSGDLNTAAQIAQQAGANDVAQLYGMLLAHRDGQAANVTPYAPQQNTPQAAMPVQAPVPVVGVRPNVPTKLPDNLEERRKLGRALGRFMLANNFNIAPQLRDDLSMGRGNAIRKADEKITAWEEKRAAEEQSAVENGSVNAPQTAQADAQSIQNAPQDRILAQRGESAQNGSKAVRGESVQNQGEQLSPKNAAKKKLREIQGQEIINKETGIPAILNAKGINKMLSNAAVAKSQKNGYTQAQHLAAAENIKELYENATLTAADKKGDSNIASIKRFSVDTVVDNEKAHAKITVKESVLHGHRIYSVELEALEKPVEQVKRTDIVSSTGSENPSLKGSKVSADYADGRSSTSTIPSEAEESKEKPLNEDEREAVKGLSADAKNVYRLVRDKLSGMKNEKVARAASAGAVLLARHADIIARKVRATLGTPFTAMDYYRAWFDLQYGGNADGFAQALNAGVNLDEQVPVVDITAALPQKKMSNKDVLNFLRGLAQHGNTITSADGKAVFGIDKHVRHITFSSRKGLSDDESKVRQASIRSLDDLLKHAVLVESVPNRKTSKKPAAIAYHRFYVPVSLNGKIATIRIVGEERGDVITFSPTNVHLYDVIVEKRSSRPPQGISPFGGSTRASDTISIRDTRVSVNTEKAARTPAGISPVMGSANGLSTISIRDMLTGVKDADGNVYAQSAWHGSPYDFREFLLSMIGVGEGAQAHGWGLYFAQNRKVSERYKERLTQHGHKTLYTMTYDGKPVEEQSPSIQRAMHELSGTVHSMHGDGVADTVSAYRNGHEKDLRLWQKHLEEFDRAIALYEGNSKVSLRTLRDSVPKYSNAGATIDSAEASTSGKRRTAEDAVRALKEKRKLYVARVKEEEQAIRDLDAIDADKIRIEVQAPVGKLFEVEIPDDDVLIDEQKPFDEQSKFVQEKLEEMFHKVERETLLLALAKQDVRFDEVHGDYCDLLDMEETLAHTENPSAWQQEEVEELRGRVNRELERLLQGDSFERALLRSFRSGREIYHEVRKMFAPHRLDKEASLALNEVGIKGITYDGQRDGRCYVIFDDKAISIIEKFNQQMNAIVKGTTQDMKDGQRIISLLTEADESTFLHEMGHLFLLDLERLADMSPTSAEELQTVRKWAAWSEGQAEEYKDMPFAAEFAYLDARIRAALKKGAEKKAEKLKRQWEHERFARGFEMYLKHGESPTKGLRAVFAKFRAFLQRVYQAFTGTGGRATAEVEAVMARMISIEDSSDLSAYPQGKKTAVYTDSGKKISVQYRVVSADDLIASHDAGALEINPGYPVALQPRDRERLIMREQVTRMANTLRPEDLADGRNLNQGAPLIRNDGIVLNGNGRIIAIQRAQARNKERATAYRDYLVENAATFGFSKEEVESVKNPVLVREVQGDISDGLMQDIIGSTTGGARMGASEAAQQDAGKITYAMLDTYVPNDKGDLTTAANRSFVAGILHKLVGKDEMNAYLDKDGHVNADGIQRVKRALFALAYGADELIAKMAESTDDDIRNVSNGLMSAAPMVARLSVKKGALYVKELQDVIADAVKQMDTLRRSGESVKDYLGAQALFTEHEDSAEMRAILSFLDENKRSGKRIATYFSRTAKTLDEMEVPSGNELFDAEMPSLMDVLEGARGYAENGGQEGLFGDNAQEVTEIKTALVNLARAAWSDKKAQGKVSFKPSQKLRDKVREFFGHDIDEVFITADDMRHMKNAHSDGEEKRGQVNLTPEDFAEVYHVVNEFDSATKERDDRRGNQNILVVKNADGRMFALLVERGKNKAEIKTVYKYKKPSPMSDAISPNLNARSDSAKVSSTSNIPRREAKGKQEPTLENILQLAPALKKAALEYGARDENGKVTFADEERKQEFLKVAKALLGARERKTSARRQESLKEMLDGIRLIPPTRVSPRKRVIADWGREMGVSVVFFKGNPSLHGFHSNGVTFLNVDSEITPQWTFWHEAMHWMKANNPDIYNDLVRAVSGAEGFTKKQLDAYRREIGAPRMSVSDVIEEMLADALPDVKRRVPLLRDVGKRDKNVVQRLVAWIHDVMRRFHDYFRAPHAGLTSDQRLAMVKAFGNLVGSLRDADGKLIFRVQNEGARITLRDGKPLPAVKFSLDNTGKVGDNEGGRNLGEARKEAICSNVLARMKTRVHEMLKQGVSFAEIQKELEDENSTSREEALRVFKTQWNIFNSPRVNKRNIVERITKREDFTDDEVNELFEQYKATMKEMLDYGGFIYKEAAFQQRGNREFLAGVHSWRDLERANARHGGSAHTGHKNSLNTKHLESQGAFSTPKFSANTSGESPKGNFKLLKDRIRSLVGVAPANNLELPGRPTREAILSPQELERRIKERWIQEKNIISQERQTDGKIRVTYYPDTHDVGYADGVKSVRQVAKRNPFVQALYKRAHAAMKKQEHLRNEFGKVLKTFADLVKNPEDLKTVSIILWLGDANGKVYTDAELRSMGASENAIKAYKLVREVLERAYKMLNDARMQVQTRSQTMAAESVETFKKNHWIKDEDVISVEKHRDGQVLLTWRGGKTYETKDKMITTEALELLQKDDDIIVTRATPLSPTQYGEGMYEVDYVERIKPIHRLTGYMPHFFHEWMVYEKYQDPNTGQTRYTTIGSGRTMNEAVKIGNEIAAKNKDKQYVLRPKGFDLGAENSVVIGDMDFAQMTKKLAENTEMTLTDARAFLQEDVGVSLKSRHRFLGNAMKRKGAEGFDEDVMWVLAHYLNSTARYVAMEEFKPWAISMYERFFGAFDAEPKNLTAKYCKDFINDVNGNPRGVEVWLNDLIKKTWLGKHVADSYGDRVALAINGELSTWNAITKLGLGNFASAAVNFSQFINIGAALNDYGYAMKGLKKALNPSALDEKIIEASGLLDDINMADDNGGYTQRRGGKVRGIYSAVKKGGEWTLIPFQKADTLMRKAAVLGAYYQGVEQKGMKTAPGDELSAEALDYAQEINDDANFDYSSANAPNMLRAGSVVTQQLFQFQKYPIMQFEFMYNILKNGTRGQKVRMFVPYVLFCGIGASIPFGSLFNQLFSFLFGLATGDDEDIAQEVKAEVLRWAGKDPLKKAIAETALYGVLAPTFGLDISGRIGMSNSFAGEFYGEKPDSISGIAGQQLGGPMAVSAINMLRQAHEGNPIEALKALSPALGNMAQAWAGESRTTRHRVNTRYDTAYDKIAHALGFRSVDESNNAFIMNYEYEQKSKQNRTKQEAIQDYLDDPSDANRRTINALGITERQIKEARIQQERTALERATKGRPNTSRKHRASQRRKEEAKRETLYDTLDDE